MSVEASQFMPFAFIAANSPPLMVCQLIPHSMKKVLYSFITTCKTSKANYHTSVHLLVCVSKDI